MIVTNYLVEREREKKEEKETEGDGVIGVYG